MLVSALFFVALWWDRTCVEMKLASASLTPDWTTKNPSRLSIARALQSRARVHMLPGLLPDDFFLGRFG